MTTMFRIAAALALVGLATPAFPCGGQKMTTASTAEAKGKQQVAKADKKAPAKTAQVAQQTKAAKASN